LEEDDDWNGEGRACGNIGACLQELGKADDAILMFERYLQFTMRIGDLRSEGAACTAIGYALDSLGKYADALEWHERRLEIAQVCTVVHGVVHGVVYGM
jgi:tetratricopeptide (TPR) repeat protein